MAERGADFSLATVSVAGCAPFPVLVLAERAYALRALSDFIRGTYGTITGYGSMLEVLEDWPANLPRLQAGAAALMAAPDSPLGRRGAPLEHLTFHPPVSRPGQVYCSGANYKRHVVQIIIAQSSDATQDMSPEERRAYGEKMMDERAAKGTPFFFVKAQSTITGPFDTLYLPSEARQPDWELELAVVMGRRARR